MKTSNSVLSTVVVSVLGLSATLSAPQALAVDGKTYPGYMCKQWNGTGWSQTGYSSIYNGANGSVSPTPWVYLDCLVVKDSTSIFSGWVQVTDRHFSENINCRLWSVYPAIGDSTIRLAFRAASSSDAGNGVKTLNFGSLPAVSNSHYFYDCAIPPTYLGNPNNTSVLHTYNVTEND